MIEAQAGVVLGHGQPALDDVGLAVGVEVRAGAEIDARPRRPPRAEIGERVEGRGRVGTVLVVEAGGAGQLDLIVDVVAHTAGPRKVVSSSPSRRMRL